MASASSSEQVDIETDPLISRAERLAVGTGVAVQPLAEFALGLAVVSQQLDVDDTIPHPDAFWIGRRCGSVLQLRISPEDLSRQVDTYLAQRLKIVQVVMGDNWQWQDAFPASNSGQA